MIFHPRRSISCAGYRIEILIHLPPIPMTLTDPDTRSVITPSPHIPLLSETTNRPNVSRHYGESSHAHGSLSEYINTTICNLFDFRVLGMIKSHPIVTPTRTFG